MYCNSLFFNILNNSLRFGHDVYDGRIARVRSITAMMLKINNSPLYHRQQPTRTGLLYVQYIYTALFTVYYRNCLFQLLSVLECAVPVFRTTMHFVLVISGNRPRTISFSNLNLSS